MSAIHHATKHGDETATVSWSLVAVDASVAATPVAALQLARDIQRVVTQCDQRAAVSS